MSSSQLSNRRSFALAVASMFVGRRLFAEPPTQASANPTFSSDVKVVNTFVTVRDSKGNIVKDLTKDDFTLLEDGRAQTIHYFSQQSDLALTVGLLVDVTPSETNMLGVERSASRSFLAKVLRPDKDKAFLIQFGDEVDLLQDLTSSRQKLEKALDQLQGSDDQMTRRGRPWLNFQGPPGRNSDDDRRGQRRGGGGDSTVLSDAIYLSATDVLKDQTGRKAVIVLGDGDHIGNREGQAVSSAQRAGLLVYTIRIYDRDFGSGGGSRSWRGLNIPGIGGIGGPSGGGPNGGPPGGMPGGGGPSRSDGKKHLQEISAQTGGAYFEVTKKQSLEDIYRKIEEELRNQYSLGYTPDANAASGYRHIKVATKQKGLIVQSRDGYYSDSL